MGLEELLVDPVLTCCQHGDGTSGRNLVNSPEPIDQKHLSIRHVLHQLNTAESSPARPKGGQRPASAVQRERERAQEGF